MADLLGKARGSARVSADEKYRYLLSRTMGAGPTATFIMLNPSSATAERDDPTIRRCLGFCQRWRCGTLQVVNLFGVRATSPRDMMKADDPVGPDNREAFDEAMDNVRDAHDEKPGPVVCAWGAHGGFMEQDLEMMRRIDACPWIKPMCLGVTTKGHARHPLYVPIRARLVPYEGRRFVASRHKTAVQATMEIEIRIRRVT